MKKTDLKRLTVTALLCAAAYLCMFLFKFKVMFLTFDLKDAVLAVTAFLYGPVYGVLSAVMVALLEFITVSDTGVYGLIMNALSSTAFVTVCGLVYRYRRTLFGAIMGSVTAVIAMTGVMMLANLWITPFYMGVSTADVAGMIPTLLLPFNLAKGVVNAASTMIIYKPITTALTKAGLSAGSSHKTDLKKFIPLTIGAMAILALALVVILVVLNGEFSFM